MNNYCTIALVHCNELINKIINKPLEKDLFIKYKILINNNLFNGYKTKLWQKEQYHRFDLKILE